jgi:hypothetical protein
MNLALVRRPLPLGATWLYHLMPRFDGTPLYIGVAGDLRLRMNQHRKSKPWWREVDHVVAYIYPTRLGALAAEACGIRCTVAPPRYNLSIPSARVEARGDEDAICYIDLSLRDVL